MRNLISTHFQTLQNMIRLQYRHPRPFASGDQPVGGKALYYNMIVKTETGKNKHAEYRFIAPFLTFCGKNGVIQNSGRVTLKYVMKFTAGCIDATTREIAGYPLRQFQMQIWKFICKFPNLASVLESRIVTSAIKLPHILRKSEEFMNPHVLPLHFDSGAREYEASIDSLSRLFFTIKIGKTIPPIIQNFLCKPCQIFFYHVK